MKQITSILVALTAFFASVQAQGPVLAWEHPGAPLFRVHVDGRPAYDIPVPAGVSSPYEWPMPDAVRRGRTFMVEACTLLGVCAASATIQVVGATPPVNVRAQDATGRLGGTLPTGTIAGSGGQPPAPGPITDIAPADNAVDVSITPTLAFASVGATSYSVQFGPVVNGTPQMAQYVLGAANTFAPDTLAYNTPYAWIPCATNTASTVCASLQTFTTLAQPGNAPSNIAASAPTDAATSVAIATTVTCTATDANSYVIRFGTVNPPVTETDLGDTCAHTPGTLAYATTYYWRIVATNAIGTTTSSVFSFTTRTEPSASGFCARPCTRSLTSAKKTELVARRNANTAPYLALKLMADQVPSANVTDVTTLSGALGTGGAGTTFSVADGSIFPASGNFQVRIDVEVLTVNRASNVLTVVSRSDSVYADTLGPQTHASGAEVWDLTVKPSENCVPHSIAVALMEHAGTTGYEQRARACLGLMLAANAPLEERYNGNTVRLAWWHIALVYDWVYEHLSANEVAVFGAILEDTARWHLEVTKYCLDGRCPTRQGVWEAATIANIQAGQIRGVLALAAATAGDSSSAQAQWAQAYTYYNDYLIPAVASGPIYAGNTPEGAHYGQEGLEITASILNLVEAAIGEDSWARVPGWETRVAKFQTYSLQPSGRTHRYPEAGYYTFGTMATGGTDLTVLNATTFDVGDNLTVELKGRSGNTAGALTVDAVTNTDVLPSGYTPVAGDVGAAIHMLPLSGADGFNLGMYTITAIVNGKWRLNASPAAVGKATYWWSIPVYGYNTVVVAKAGSVLTLRDPAPYIAENGVVTHQVTSEAYGDVETYNNFDDLVMSYHGTLAMYIMLDRLRTSDPTWAGYVKYVLDTGWPGDGLSTTKVFKFLDYDSSVVGVNPFAAGLAVNYSTAASAAASGSTGMLIGQSGWTKTATRVNFIVGGEIGNRGFDHADHYINTYRFKRKGVELAGNLRGYGVTGLHVPGPYTTTKDAECNTAIHGAGCTGLSANPFVGWRYKNGGISINGHGTSILTNCEPYAAAVLSRSDVQTTHLYGRGNADGSFRYVFQTSPNCPDTTVRTVQRDFLYVLPDLVAVNDYIALSSAAVKPTRWYVNTPGDPSVSSQRITATYSTQKLVQDVLLPTSATFTETANSADDVFLKGFRLEIRSSSASAVTAERYCTVLQGMDSGDSPVAVTTLTTTNACVMEVAVNASCPNGCVIGFVSGTAPTLPIEYTYTAAAPDHYLYGLATSTAYHITRATKTVTIATATGSGDTTSSASGRLAVP